MKFESTPEQHEKITKLTEFFGSQKEGVELPWMLIGSSEANGGSGVPMDYKGRSMARAVLVKTRGRSGYRSVRGEGVILTAPDTAMLVVNEGGRRVGRAIKNWGKTVEDARERHIDRMCNEDKQQLIARLAFVGALKTMAPSCTVKRLGTGK